MKKQFVFFVLSVLLSSTCFGNWNPESVKWAKNFGPPSENFKSPEGITTWMVGQSYNLKYHLFLGAMSENVIELSSHFFKNKQFRIFLSLQKDESGEVLRRPLVVFLPGIFGGIGSPSVFRAFQNFSRRGFHVLALPNPWSSEYLKSIPLNGETGEEETIVNPGSLAIEAQAVLRLVSQVRGDKIPRGAVSKTFLVGESYGAFLGLVAGALDTEASPVFDGKITLFASPLDVNGSLTSLDDGYFRTKQTYDQVCKENALWLGLKFYWATESSPWDQSMTHCAGPMIFHEFQHELVGTARILKSIKHLETEVPEHLRFKDFVRNFTPENQKELELGEKTNLLYWIRKYSAEKKKQLRIMASEDDFINQKASMPSLSHPPISWNLIQEEFARGPQGSENHQLLVLPWGGHVGFAALKSFQKLLDYAFRWDENTMDLAEIIEIQHFMSEEEQVESAH